MKHLIKPGVYEKLFRDEQYRKYECLEKLGVVFQGEIVDIGCGTGFLYEYISSKHGFNGRYICIEPDYGMLKIASKKITTPFTILIQAYGEELPIREELNSLVVSISTWGALRKDKLVLQEFKAIAGPRGRVVITGYPRTYSVSPSDLDENYVYLGSCIDDVFSTL